MDFRIVGWPSRSQSTAVPAAVPTKSFLLSGLNAADRRPVGLEQRLTESPARERVPKAHRPIVARGDGDPPVRAKGGDVRYW